MVIMGSAVEISHNNLHLAGRELTAAQNFFAHL